MRSGKPGIYKQGLDETTPEALVETRKALGDFVASIERRRQRDPLCGD